MVLCLDCDALRFELAQGGKTRKRVDVVAGDVRLPACGHQSAREYARSLPAGGIQYRNAVDEPGVVPRAPNFPLFASSISYLQNLGVQVESNSGHLRPGSLKEGSPHDLSKIAR